MEEAKTIKKAVLYARVSSDAQKKKKTIDSQINELKRQISNDGNVLVKEYVDEGYSGARLDRPALDQLRRELKTDLFETIYFINTDRIARDSTYQNIILSEILKYKKQLIINGKDYVQNPENKFALTVLGAVSELERAKILERNARGKAYKLSQGCHPGRGHNIYGYNYIKRAPDMKSSYLEINEREANTVRFIFDQYVADEEGMNQLTRKLEDEGHIPKNGGQLWHTGVVKNMIKNHAYTGTMYFNRLKVIKEYANPIIGTATSKKYVRTDKTTWIGLKVPAIVSQEVFDKAQEKLLRNRKKYRNPKKLQLLANLITCGICGSSYFSSYRYVRKPTSIDPSKLLHRYIYMCNWRYRARVHSLKSGRTRCVNKEVTAPIFENKIWNIVETTMINPEELRKKIPDIQGNQQNAQLRLKRRLIKIDKDILALNKKKERIIYLYTSKDLDHSMYVKENSKLDEGLKKLGLEKIEITRNTPVLFNEDIIDYSIKQYCENVRLRYEKSIDFDTKRKFCLDFIKEIVHEGDRVVLHGSVPLLQEGEKSKLEFKIERVITQADRYRPNTGCFKSGICYYRPFKKKLVT